MSWQEIIITIVGTVATALASWLVAWITSLINTKIKDEKVRACLNSALEVVTRTVKVTYQTYVANIKGTDAWTADAQKNALQLAIAAAKTQLTDEVKNYIAQSGLTVDEWLRQQIEAAIYSLKANSGKEAADNANG